MVLCGREDWLIINHEMLALATLATRPFLETGTVSLGLKRL